MTPFVQFNCLRLNKDAILPNQVTEQEDAGWEVYITEELVLKPGQNIIKPGIAIQLEVLGFDLEGFMTSPGNHKQAQPVHTAYNMLNYMYKNQFRLWLQIRDKSGMALQGIRVSGGIVDKQYTGEINLILDNVTDDDIYLPASRKVVQIIPMLTPIACLKDVDHLGETVRGDGKMGSTGILA